MGKPSAAFYALIEPARGDRLLVLGSGAFLSLVGILPILSFTIPRSLRAACVIAWLGFCLLELGRLANAYRYVTALRLAEGRVLETRGARGNWRSAELLSGTIVLDRAIWLRYASADGRSSAELITGDSRSNPGFRRLKIVLRHAEAARKG